MKQLVGVILNKVLNILGIILGIAFTPIQYFICGLKFEYSNFIVLIILSFFIVSFFWLGLLKTNNPITRYNPFTINKKFKNTMEYSMEEKPGQLFEFDEPSDEEIKQKNRDKKLKELGI